MGSTPSDTTLLDKPEIPNRPEQLKFPRLNYEPPAPEQFQRRAGDRTVVVGNAILSRWPIEATEVRPLTPLDAPDEGRCLVHARTAGLDVFCTHLNWQYHHGYIREAQVLKVVGTIEAQADATSPFPPILCGDLNANPDSDEIRFLCGLASLEGRSAFFQEAWRVAGGTGPGYTWDNRNSFAALDREPDGRIDYIFVGWRRDSGAGRVESARVVCDRSLTGTFASDHFGVMAEIAGPAPS